MLGNIPDWSCRKFSETAYSQRREGGWISLAVPGTDCKWVEPLFEVSFFSLGGTTHRVLLDLPPPPHILRSAERGEGVKKTFTLWMVSKICSNIRRSIDWSGSACVFSTHNKYSQLLLWKTPSIYGMLNFITKFHFIMKFQSGHTFRPFWCSVHSFCFWYCLRICQWNCCCFLMDFRESIREVLLESAYAFWIFAVVEHSLKNHTLNVQFFTFFRSLKNSTFLSPMGKWTLKKFASKIYP